MSLKAKSVTGAKWAIISQILNQIVQLYIGIKLAILLDPGDFGLVGMVYVFSRFTQVLADAGIGAAIIQKDNIETRELNSAFWFSIAIGFLLFIVLSLVAPLIANFFSQPILTSLTRWIASTFLIASLCIVPISLLVKEFRFRDIAIIESMSFFLGGIVAIVAAVNGLGVWSLIIQAMGMAISKTVIVFFLSKWRPKILFDWNAVKGLFPFSMNLTGAQLINYWVRNADNLLIGKFLGEVDLGLYSRAYSFMLIPVQQVSAVASRIMFPAFSEIQNDVPRIRAIYLRTISMIALLTFPIGLGLMVVANNFVYGVLGEEWAGMVPILQILCILSLTQSLGATAGVIYQSLGRTDIQLKWSIYASVVYISAFVFGLQWGVVGVAASYTIASLVFITIPNAMLVGSLVNISLPQFGNVIYGVFGCAAVMALCVHTIGILLNDLFERKWILAIMIAAGISIYLALIILFRIEAFREMKRLIDSKT